MSAETAPRAVGSVSPLLGWVGFVPGLLAIVAFLTSPWPLLTKLQLLGSGICAQRPAHSYFLGGQQLPVEARMVGIFGGFGVALAILALVGAPRAGRLPRPTLLFIAAFLVMTMVADGINATLFDARLPHLYQPVNALRLGTGLGSGLGLAVLILPIIRSTLWADLQPVAAARGPGMVWAALGVGGLGAATLSGQTAWLWPVALVAMGGALTLVGVGNLIMVLAVARRENRFHSFRQLGPYLSAALVLAAVELGGLAYLRVLVDRSLA